ncbi:13598_t:CDS:2 [Cetraspora pellucida]|uniref:13598_t:CDS:1 n=1 Tax=Cetraspora pellucida TaxID=1433469 RepID=A0ACA9JXV7_9GLOM|nr:13598_t:CDS:2 [Cetraspora pellucida]
MSRHPSSLFDNDDLEINATFEDINIIRPKNIIERRVPIQEMSIEEQELLRKIDIRIIPLFSLLYTLSFMDKLNIGNAKLEHLEEDLELTQSQYNMVLISTIMLACGIIIMSTAAAKDFPQIMILRFLLGAFEAGFFPGAIFYITKWYKNREENYRISLFVSAGIIAGALSGLMSFSVATLLNEVNGLSGWQWVFILDGAFTCIVALLSYYLIPDSPETAIWLTKEERRFAIERLHDEPSHSHESYSESHQILDAFNDWKIYMAMLLYFCINAPLYSFSIFISSIVNGMGFSTGISLILATPPFILGSSFSILIAISSDCTGFRGPYIIGCLLISIVGYVFLIVHDTSTAVKYIGACIIGIGLFPCIPTSITWLINNLAGETKCAIGDAMMIAAGNIGAGISTQFYKYYDAPSYRFGHIVSLSLLIVALILCLIKFHLLSRANDKKFEQGFNEGMNEEYMKFGDKHPSFIYSL